MSAIDGNVLIVEDHSDWCDAYVRAASMEGFEVIKVAKDLTEAESLIEAYQFAVAFIDIGLDVGDDQNVDGVLVMEKIRNSGDPTSIVVVTGRSGRDVISITRDSIRKYAAFEIVAKAEIEPKDIRALLRGGLEAFEDKQRESLPAAHEVLRGGQESWAWDDEMLRVSGAKRGARGLYDFLDELVADLMPLVPRIDGELLAVDGALGAVHGSFWSRSLGQAIAICFGAQQNVREKIDGAVPVGMLLGTYPVESELKRFSGHGLLGGVFALRGMARDMFAST